MNVNAHQVAHNVNRNLICCCTSRAGFARTRCLPMSVAAMSRGEFFFRMVTFLCERDVHFALLPIPLRSMIEFAKGRQCEVCISSSHIPRLDVLASGSSEFMVQACKVSVRRLTTSVLSLSSRVGRHLGGSPRLLPPRGKRSRRGITSGVHRCV